MTNSLTAFSYRHLKAARTVFCMALCALILNSFGINAQAWANELYTVEDVEVDVTAKNAVEAREKAFMEAQVKAYQMLKERLLVGSPDISVDELDAESISFLVQDFEVTKEQLTTKRYKGNYTIRFRPDAFQKKMVAENKTFTDLPRGDVLILPFYQSASDTILWDRTNPFMAAWTRARSNEDAIASTVVPIGDIDDVSQINEFSPLNYDANKLDQVRQRYSANETLITMASPEVTPDGRENIRISLYKAMFDGPKFSGQMTIEGAPGEPNSILYDRAVERVQQKLKSDWKQETAVTSSDLRTIKAAMYFNTVREWIDSKRSLESVPGIKAVRVMQLSPREARLEIDFQGEIERLNFALQRSGIFMNKSADKLGELYVLKKTAFPPVQSPYYQ